MVGYRFWKYRFWSGSSGEVNGGDGISFGKTPWDCDR